MPWYAWYLSGLLSASLWLLLVTALLAAGRPRRPHGFTATGRASAGGSRATVRRVRTYTGCWTDGQLREDEVARAVQRGVSRTTAPTGSGAATGGSRGADKPPTTASMSPESERAMALVAENLARHLSPERRAALRRKWGIEPRLP